jgi:UDP-glucose 4-epimerase
LINAGNNILVIDDLSSGYENNISDWLNNSFLKKKVQKVSDEKINSIDGIFHLAAQASVPYSIDNFFNSSENNILSSLKVFSWAKAQNIPVVYASSSAVYGNLPIGDDQIEEYDILSPYAQDKLILENYARMCWDVYKTPSIGLRFFNVYGPRQDSTNQYSGVISIFIDRLIQNKPVIVNGGYQTRDFIFVDDIVRVMIKSMKHLLYNRSCDVFNVGTGVSVTIDQLLEILAEILKVEPEVKTKELPPGDPEKSGGTYGKLTTALNIDIHQFVKLEDGLRNTIDYIRNEQSK